MPYVSFPSVKNIGATKTYITILSVPRQLLYLNSTYLDHLTIKKMYRAKKVHDCSRLNVVCVVRFIFGWSKNFKFEKWWMLQWWHDLLSPITALNEQYLSVRAAARTRFHLILVLFLSLHFDTKITYFMCQIAINRQFMV